MWYLAVLDVAVGLGGERLACSSWRRCRCYQLCWDVLASTRRDWHVGAVANVSCDVVLEIFDMRPRWNHGSAWAAWWVRSEYPTWKHSVIDAWDGAKMDLPRARCYPTWHVVTVGGLSEVGSEKLRSFDGLSELVGERVTCMVRVPFYWWFGGSVVFIRPMEVNCCFRVSRKFFGTFEIIVIGLGMDYFGDGLIIGGPKQYISKWNYLKWCRNGEVDIFR